MSTDKKIKVGFGPATTANSFYQSGVKVAEEMNKDGRFACSHFSEPFNLEDLLAFDVLIFVKICPSYEMLKKLKNAGKVLILDYQDMFLFPSVYEKNRLKKALKKLYYMELEKKERMRYGLFDRCLVASPAAKEIVAEAGMKPHFLMRQIYNDRNRDNPRVHTEKTSGLRIFWTGVALNLDENAPVEPVLRELCRKHDSRVVYLTQAEEKKDFFIEYRRWSLDTWEKEMAGADIAFRWWRDSNNQYYKDSNKVISYMAAGLPVVCRPTLSDRLVIEHGRTGFFADTRKEFAILMERLILDPGLRRKVGKAAFTEVWSKYALSEHVGEIKRFMLGLIEERSGMIAV